MTVDIRAHIQCYCALHVYGRSCNRNRKPKPKTTRKLDRGLPGRGRRIEDYSIHYMYFLQACWSNNPSVDISLSFGYGRSPKCFDVVTSSTQAISSVKLSILLGTTLLYKCLTSTTQTIRVNRSLQSNQ